MVFRPPNYWSNWKLEMLVLRRGENRSTRKKTSLSKEENQQQTNPKNSGVEAGNLNLGYIGGQPVLSSLRHPFTPCKGIQDSLGSWILI